MANAASSEAAADSTPSNLQDRMPTQYKELLLGSTLLTQGAEGVRWFDSVDPSARAILTQFPQRVYAGHYEGQPCIVKWRFPKTYRHPDLDKSLTAARAKAEARSLQRCAEAGLRVPALLLADASQGLVVMERVKGGTIAACMRIIAAAGATLDEPFTVSDSGVVTLASAHDSASSTGAQAAPSPKAGPQPGHHTLRQLARHIGRVIAQLHNACMTHGDLTTSNMLAVATPVADTEAAVCLIDFGLTTKGSSPNLEDMGVDLYVLERAIGSSHPKQLDMWDAVLAAYLETVDSSDAISTRFEAVRARGRKRTAFG